MTSEKGVDYDIEVEGDCKHMPGMTTGRQGCMLCNPRKPEPPRQQMTTTGGYGIFRRHGGGIVESDVEWVHADCGDPHHPARREAIYQSQCHGCGEYIDEGDDIVPVPI
jgi:hypothetical protein